MCSLGGTPLTLQEGARASSPIKTSLCADDLLRSADYGWIAASQQEINKIVCQRSQLPTALRFPLLALQEGTWPYGLKNRPFTARETRFVGLVSVAYPRFYKEVEKGVVGLRRRKPT